MGGRVYHAGLRHGLHIGQPVTIIRLAIDGPPYIEGRAILGARERGLWYRVRFDGEPIWRLRAVHPVLLLDPESIAAAFRDLWRAEQALRASFSDFFPSANSDD